MIEYGHLLLNIKNNMKWIKTYKIFESDDFDPGYDDEFDSLTLKFSKKATVY